MAQHLIVVHLEPSGATLRARDGRTFEVPADWLPVDTQEGAAVLADVSPGGHRTELTVRLVEGITEPEGTDVGA
jgi:hypothetical protein